MSSLSDVLSIDQSGLATALALGESVITAVTDSVETSIAVAVGESTVSSTQSIVGEIITTSSYIMEGDFEMTVADGVATIVIADNYRASTALPGLYIYLSNNRASIQNALEVGAVDVFSGAHSYEIEDVGLDDYAYIVYFCKPFNVKVGEAVLND